MKWALNGKAKKKWMEITIKKMAWNKANMQKSSTRCFKSLESKFLELRLTKNKVK
jgi:hypothetical protein